MANIEFTYLYRDANNWKKWGGVVFSNPEGMSLDEVARTLRQAFLQDGLFIADQIRIDEVFLYERESPTPADHCFHEFAGVRKSCKLPNDEHRRSIGRFVAEVKEQAQEGWEPFDPDEKALWSVPIVCRRIQPARI